MLTSPLYRPSTAAAFALASTLALAAVAAKAAPVSVPLTNATVTLDTGEPGTPPGPGSFNAQWSAAPDAVAGWTLDSSQYRVTTSGSRLRIDFLPFDFGGEPTMEHESTLHFFGGAYGCCRFSQITGASGSAALPLTIAPAPSHHIAGYHFEIGLDYSRSAGIDGINGTFVHTGTMSVGLKGGGTKQLVSYDLRERTPGQQTLVLHGRAPASADFSTLAGSFLTAFDLDPRPDGWSPDDPWGPVGDGSSEVALRYIAVDVIAAPEPATWILMAAGAGGIVAVGRVSRTRRPAAGTL